MTYDKMSSCPHWHKICDKEKCTTKANINLKQNRIMQIKPLSDRVLIEAAEAVENTVGRIIIPDAAKEKPLKGTVVATGNGTKDEEMIVKVGDTVLYGKYAGTEIAFECKKFLKMRQYDILAIIG